MVPQTSHNLCASLDVETRIHHWSVHLLFLDYSLEQYKSCVQMGLDIGANIYGTYVSVGFQGGSCDGLLNEMGGEVS